MRKHESVELPRNALASEAAAAIARVVSAPIESIIRGNRRR